MTYATKPKTVLFISQGDIEYGKITNCGRQAIGLFACPVAYSCMSKLPRKTCEYYGTCSALRGFYMPNDQWFFDKYCGGKEPALDDFTKPQLDFAI